LLVLVAVQGHLSARLEVDQVQHRAGAEQRPARHALGKDERADVVEADELRLHGEPIILDGWPIGRRSAYPCWPSRSATTRTPCASAISCSSPGSSQLTKAACSTTSPSPTSRRARSSATWVRCSPPRARPSRTWPR